MRVSKNLLSSLHGRVFSSCFGQSSLFLLYLSLSHITAPSPFCTSFWHYVGTGSLEWHYNVTQSHCASSQLIKRHAVQHCATSPADPKLLQRPNSGWGSKIGYVTLSSAFFYQTLFHLIRYWLSLLKSLIFQKNPQILHLFRKIQMKTDRCGHPKSWVKIWSLQRRPSPKQQTGLQCFLLLSCRQLTWRPTHLQVKLWIIMLLMSKPELRIRIQPINSCWSGSGSGSKTCL
jgi:hypothetical protein